MGELKYWVILEMTEEIPWNQTGLPKQHKRQKIKHEISKEKYYTLMRDLTK